MLRSMLSALVLTALLMFGPAYGEEEARPLVKLNLTEKVEGKKSTRNYPQKMVRDFLKLLGFDVLSVQPTKWDKKDKEFAKKQSALKSRKPDFIIEGTLQTKYSHPSMFYERTVAFVFRGEAKVTIKDSRGKVLTKWNESILIGASNQGKSPKQRAARNSISKLSFFMCPIIYRLQPMQDKMNASKKGKIEKKIKAIEKMHKKYKADSAKHKKKAPKPKKDPKKDNGGGPF